MYVWENTAIFNAQMMLHKLMVVMCIESLVLWDSIADCDTMKIVCHNQHNPSN
jgi:hypothetical protein